MTLRAISTPAAPKAIGPYSQAIEAVGGTLVFLSGQIGIDPVTGNLSVTPEEQTTRAMDNLHAVLQGSGLGFGASERNRNSGETSAPRSEKKIASSNGSPCLRAA